MNAQTSFPISSNKAMPKKNTPTRYPFAKLSVGQSFDVPISGKRWKCGNGYTMPVELHRICAAAAGYQKRHEGTSFSCRTLVDEGVVRCWRVA